MITWRWHFSLVFGRFQSVWWQHWSYKRWLYLCSLWRVQCCMSDRLQSITPRGSACWLWTALCVVIEYKSMYWSQVICTCLLYFSETNTVAGLDKHALRTKSRHWSSYKVSTNKVSSRSVHLQGVCLQEVSSYQKFLNMKINSSFIFAWMKRSVMKEMINSFTNSQVRW